MQELQEVEKYEETKEKSKKYKQKKVRSVLKNIRLVFGLTVLSMIVFMVGFSVFTLGFGHMSYTTLDDGTYAISGTNLDKMEGKIEISDNKGGVKVTAIADNGFDSATNITSVIIPEGVTYIGKEAFSECTALEIITLPTTLTYIGEGAFYGCTDLEKISFVNSKGWQNHYGIGMSDVFSSPKEAAEYLTYSRDEYYERKN